MTNLKLSIIGALCLTFLNVSYAQVVYRDGFTNNGTPPNSAPYWGTAAGYTITHIDNTTTTNITGNGSTPPLTSIYYGLYDNPQMLGIGSYTGTTGSPIPSIDMSGDRTIYVIARATHGTPELRLSVKDASGYTSDSGTLTDINTLSNTSQV
ncbi:MAG: hypothetical protein NZ529_01640 [Cytophagaceae bacterium]|nr:hypothetical protein [Cytophagaceae bacterium]MDW8455469.1 hypothetical protein [Cytophagaceae bacterium]